MKVLFIHAYNYYEPLGIMYLSAFIKSKGHSCYFIDVKFQKNYVNEAKSIKPDVVAYSTNTNNWRQYQQINVKLKNQFRFLSVFGGPHCTFSPQAIEEEGVDVICRGEGEYPLLELLDALSNESDITGIQNLWVKKHGVIFKNDVRSLEENLDVFPFPDRQLINKYEHYQKRSRIRTITSRGCPFNCSYCFNHANQKLYKDKGTYIRQRSPKNVIDEIKILKASYSPKNFEFHDDIFILNNQWLREFAYLYITEEINIPFEINVRVDLINDENIELLQRAGCFSVQFGIESGNESIRRNLLKRNISNDLIIDVAAKLKKAGFRINTYNMIGYPEETIGNAFETMQLNAKCFPDYAMNTIYFPYPMNELTAYSDKLGLLDKNLERNRKNLFYGDIVLKTPYKKQMQRLHYLFAYGVKMPFLTGLIRILIKLPLGKLYHFLYFLYRAYAVIFIFKRLSIKEIL